MIQNGNQISYFKAMGMDGKANYEGFTISMNEIFELINILVKRRNRQGNNPEIIYVTTKMTVFFNRYPVQYIKICFL